jgi:hypothetical protein
VEVKICYEPQQAETTPQACAIEQLAPPSFCFASMPNVTAVAVLPEVQTASDHLPASYIEPPTSCIPAPRYLIAIHFILDTP